MNVVFIGKHKYPKDIFSNEQDLKTWRSMASYFDRLFVIAESPNLLFHSTKEKNISVYLVPNIFGYFGFVAAAVKLGFYLNLRYGIDVFDASEVAGGGTAVTLLKFLTRKSTVIEVQGEIFRKPENRQNLKSRMLQRIGRFAMNHAVRIRVISHAIFDQVKEQGISESKIRLISLRVDLTLFNPNGFVESIRRTLYVGDKVGTTIGYIGRLVDGKGLEDLLIAMSKVKSQRSNVILVIYGAGPLEPKLRKMAKELDIESKIEWRGFVPYSKVPEALAQIDIFVYPSWHEGFGRSIMEALAMEKAVVATNVGGIPDLIQDGENGFLIAPHKPTELAEKLNKLIGDKDLREKFGKTGRKLVSQNFEWNDGIKKFANLFLGLK
jgi:glycosyltransferase involved in cell wall biosynthesis